MSHPTPSFFAVNRRPATVSECAVSTFTCRCSGEQQTAADIQRKLWLIRPRFGFFWCRNNKQLTVDCVWITHQQYKVRIRTTWIFSERELTFTFAICYRPSVCLSVVCNVRVPYSGNWNFRQYFRGIRYLGHPMTSTKNFTEIVPGEPLRRGSWTQEG